MREKIDFLKTLPLFFSWKDNHEVPELELGVAAETATGSIEGTAKAAKSRAVRGETYFNK